MGRAKKHKPSRSKKRDILYHHAFVEVCEMMGWKMPYSLQRWKAYFVNSESYMKAADKWVAEKLNGVGEPTVTNDVMRGLKTFNWRENQGTFDDENYKSSTSSAGKTHYPYQGHQVTPAKPLLAEPSGLSGVTLDHAY